MKFSPFVISASNEAHNSEFDSFPLPFAATETGNSNPRIELIERIDSESELGI